jgi:hypothetical protein
MIGEESGGRVGMHHPAMYSISCRVRDGFLVQLRVGELHILIFVLASIGFVPQVFAVLAGLIGTLSFAIFAGLVGICFLARSGIINIKIVTVLDLDLVLAGRRIAGILGGV